MKNLFKKFFSVLKANYLKLFHKVCDRMLIFAPQNIHQHVSFLLVYGTYLADKVHNNKFSKIFPRRRRKILFTFGSFNFHQILHGDAKGVGEGGCLWDFVFRKLFCYIRWSEMCKNHDFSCLCLRKVACGDVWKINL